MRMKSCIGSTIQFKKYRMVITVNLPSSLNLLLNVLASSLNSISIAEIPV